MVCSPTDVITEISQELRDQMTIQTTTLSQILSRAESLSKDNHHQTRETIIQCIKEERQKSIKKGRNNNGQVVEDTDAVHFTCTQLRSRHKSSAEIRLETFEITAGIEMLNVSRPAESELRRDIYREICQSL
jgi:ElaB/YqjD/DUF883 family membrane-anchored ribosome-binding protein